MRRVVVLFRTSTATYAVDVADVVEVRPHRQVRALPHPRTYVLGMLVERSTGAALPVLDVLGRGREHVLVLRRGDVRLGVAAEVVLGLVRVEEEPVGPAPRGQEATLVSGTLALPGGDGTPHLVIDVGALAALVDDDHPDG